MDWETSEAREVKSRRTLLRKPLLSHSCWNRACPLFIIGAACVFLGYVAACFFGGGCR